MTRQVTDKLYIDLDYYNPEQYYTYVAEASVAMSATFSQTAQGYRTQEIALIAFSDAAISTTATVTKGTSANLSLESTVTIAVGGVQEFAAALSSGFSQSTLASKTSEAAVTITSEFTQTTQIERLVFINAGLESSITLATQTDRFVGFGVGLSSDAAAACVNYRIRDYDISAGALFNAAISIEVTKNSFAVLDSVSTVTAQVERQMGAITANLTDTFTINAQAEKFKTAQATAAATSTVSAAADLTKSTAVNLSATALQSVDPTYTLIYRDQLRIGYPGTHARISSVQERFGSSSLKADDVGIIDFAVQKITNPVGGLDIYDFDANDWTIEFFYWDNEDTGSGEVFERIFALKNSSGTSKLDFYKRNNATANSNIYQLESNDWTTTTPLNGTYSINAWRHFAITYVASTKAMAFYIDGSRIGTRTFGTGWTNMSRFSLGGPGFAISNAYIDELRISDQVRYTGTSFTVPTTEFPKNRKDVALFKFEQEYLESGTYYSNSEVLLVTGQSTLTSQFSQNAAAITVKLGGATLSSQGFVLAAAGRIATEVANLSSTTTLQAQGGRLQSVSAALSSQTAATGTGTRTKRFTVAIAGAFTATVTARANEGISNLTLSAPATLSITGRYANGTLRANIAGQSTVTAQGREVIKDPAPVVVPRADRVLYHFNDYLPQAFPFNQQRTLDSYDSDLFLYGSELKTSTFFNEQPKFGANAWMTPAGAPYTVPAGQQRWNLQCGDIGTGNFTFDFWFKPFSYYSIGYGQYLPNYLFRWLTNDYTNYSLSLAYEHDPVEDELVLIFTDPGDISTNIRFPWPGDRGNVSSSTGYRAYLANDWFHIAVQRNGNVLRFYVNGQSSITYTSNSTENLGDRILFDFRDDGAGTYFGTPGVFDELRIVPYAAYSTTTFTPPTQEYDVESDLYIVKYGDAWIEPRFTLGILITQNAQADFTATTAVSAAVARIRRTASGLSATVTQTAQVRRVRTTAATATVTATMSVSAARIRTTASTQSATFTQNAVNDRLRSAASEQSSNFNLNANAARSRTVSSVQDSSSELSAINDRIRYGQGNFTAFYTQLSAVAVNATGTVLLESSFATNVQVVKTTDIVSTQAATTQQSTAADRIRSTTSEQTVQTQLDIVYEKIKPNGADISAEFGLTVNTDNSRIVGIESTPTGVFTQVTDNLILRRTSAALDSQFTQTALGFRVKQVQANTLGQFSIVTLTGIRADAEATLPVVASQLSVADVIQIDEFYQYLVEAESRLGTVLPETRVFLVESETRLNMIL